MKAAEAIFLIAVFAVLVVWFVAWLIGRAAAAYKRRRLSDEPWSVHPNHDDPACVRIEVVKPGEQAHQIGPGIPTSLPHYEFLERKEELWVEAEALADEFNRDTKRLSRD